MNYFEFHLGDYAEATGHLSLLEDGVLSRLIRKIYATEKPLAQELAAVERLVGARTPEERTAVKVVLEEFFVLAEDGWRNKRCDEELARYREKRSKAQRSANARWHADQSQSERSATGMRSHGDSDAGALRSESEGNALQSPVTRLQTPGGEESARAADALRPQCERMTPASRETLDAGDALTRAAEDCLAEMNDAWKRDVDGVNVEALQRFIDFAAREANPPTKRKNFSSTARISLAKRLAGMGDLALQAQVVEQSISADHVTLYPLKDRPSKGAADAAQRRHNEQREFVGLKTRAEVIGFRAPHRGEDLADYRMRVESAERDARDAEYRKGLERRRGREGGGTKSAAELLAGGG